MAEVRINPPFGGLSDDLAFGDQVPGTTREAKNVRTIDPTNGRRRIAQRSGLDKYNTTAITAATAVKDLTSVVFDSKNITYANDTDPDEAWITVTPSEMDCLNGKSDRQGNVYALNGSAGVVKYNSKGTELWQLAIPTLDEEHVVRALHVDDFDCIYVGVSTGGQQSKARIWKFGQLIDDGGAEEIWEADLGAYCEELIVRADKLYALLNDTNGRLSSVAVLQEIDTIRPSVTSQFQVPHLAEGMAIKEDGSVLVAVDQDSTNLSMRGQDRPTPTYITPWIDWTPLDLSDAEDRIWSWYNAKETERFDVAGGVVQDGAELVRWRDLSGNGRHLTVPSGDESPTVRIQGQAGNPTISFNGVDQALESGGSAGTSVNIADQMRQMFPTYEGSMWCAVMAIRPRKGQTGSAETNVFHHSDASANSHGLVTNRAANATYTSGYSEGAISFHTVTDSGDPGGSGQGSPAQPSSDTFTTSAESTQMVIVSILYDGGIETGDAGTDVTRSLLRVNGRPIDRWESDELADAMGTEVCGNSAGDYWEGELCEIILIDRMDRDDDATEPKVLTHPKYPDGATSGDQGVAVVTIAGGGTGYAASGSITGSGGGGSGVSLTYTSTGGVIDSIALVDSGSGYSSAPTLTADGHTPGVVATFTLEMYDVGSDTEMERTEGYVAWGWGTPNHLPGFPAASSTAGTSTGQYPHPYSSEAFALDASGDERELCRPPSTEADGTAHSDALLGAVLNVEGVAKFSPQGKLLWMAYDTDPSLAKYGDGTITTGIGGYSNGVAVNSDGNVYTWGADAGGNTLRMFVDNGDDFTATGGWEAAPSLSTLVGPLRGTVDEFDNIYLPSGNTGGANACYCYNKAGSQIETFTVSDTGAQVIAAAVNPNIPEYESDLTNDIAEAVYLFSENNDTASIETVRRFDAVDVTAVTGSTRDMKNVAVLGGTIKTFTTSAIATPTGGSAALSSTAQYVQSALLFQKIYFTDGTGAYKVYDPKTDAVTDYESESSGEIAERCKLIESWRGRIVLARSPDDPQNWFMSEKDDPLNWDFFPPVPNEIQATAGNNSKAGLVPDIVNTMVPYSDDVLFFGGDKTIWQMSGDPAEGGRLDLLTDITGMSFGRPWTKDPNGVLYFFGSRGGLYQLVPGSPPRRLSMNRIERRLQDVDLSTHYMRLVYNYRDEGIHIFQMPFSGTGAVIKHWFYDIKHDAFWEDEINSTSVNPTSVFVLDGDAVGDRIMILGCADGFVRDWDEDATDDSDVSSTNVPIDALVTLGPINSEQASRNVQLSGFTAVMDNSFDGGRYEYFASEEPDSIGAVRRTGALQVGMNPPKWDRTSGAYGWVRLRNSAESQRFALERAYIHVHPAGDRVFSG